MYLLCMYTFYCCENWFLFRGWHGHVTELEGHVTAYGCHVTALECHAAVTRHSVRLDTRWGDMIATVAMWWDGTHCMEQLLLVVGSSGQRWGRRSGTCSSGGRCSGSLGSPGPVELRRRSHTWQSGDRWEYNSSAAVNVYSYYTGCSDAQCCAVVSHGSAAVHCYRQPLWAIILYH